MLHSQNQNDQLRNSSKEHGRRIVRLYAELSILRAAYYMVMPRAAHPPGPGLADNGKVETALAYMA